MATAGWYREQYKKGLCVECRKPRLEDRIRCRGHIRKDLRRKAEIVAGGRCQRCGRRRDRQGIECQSCRDKQSERAKERRVMYKAAGVCTRCSSAPAQSGRVECSGCLAKTRRRKRAA